MPAPAPAAEEPAGRALEFKAALLVLFTVLLVGCSVLYLLYVRGAFEPTQELVLTADDSEGVVVGMDLTFSGFPSGRVRRIELAPDGNARIVIDVPTRDARWLRQSSVFTLVRGLLGNTNIRAYSGMLDDPPLAPGAVRPVLRGDTAAEIPKVIGAAKDLIENVNALVAAGAPIHSTLGHLQTATAQISAAAARLNGPGGALGVLLGSDAEARKVAAALDRTNALLASGNALLQRLDGLAVRADAQVLGPQGLVPEARNGLLQLQGLLGDARASLQKVDGVLVEAQAATRNVRGATEDLAPLRAEVESSLRRIQGLIDEINRKWPFARETEIKLP